MVEITHREVDGGTFEVGDRQVSLMGTETRIEVALGSGGWAWTYRRPTKALLSDDPTSAVQLRDHVMLAKLAFVLLAIALLMKKG